MNKVSEPYQTVMVLLLLAPGVYMQIPVSFKRSSNYINEKISCITSINCKLNVERKYKIKFNVSETFRLD